MLALYAEAFCRFTILIVFLLSSVGKARDLPGFASTIAAFKVLPQGWSIAVSRIFLGGEFAVVVLLALENSLGFALADLLLVSFTLALMIVVLKNPGAAISCNCFGHNREAVSYYEIARNAGLIAVGLLGWFMDHGPLVRGGKELADLDTGSWLIAGIAAGAFVALWLNLRNIVQLFR